jgi:hypothetical protein
MKDLEVLAGKKLSQNSQGSDTENEHFREKPQTGGGKFEKVEGTKDSPGGWGKNKILADSPEIEVFNRNSLRPGHGPRFGRAYQNGQGMSHAG